MFQLVETPLEIVGYADEAGIGLENDAGSIGDYTDDSSIDTVDLDGGDDDGGGGDGGGDCDEDFCWPDCGSIEGSPVVGEVVGDDDGGDSWSDDDSDPRDRIDFEEEDSGVDM